PRERGPRADLPRGTDPGPWCRRRGRRAGPDARPGTARRRPLWLWEVRPQAVVRQHAQVGPRDLAGDLVTSRAEVQTLSFGGLSIAHDDRVLRPRRWTLHQSHWALELLPGLPDGPVLELCSGA